MRSDGASLYGVACSRLTILDNKTRGTQSLTRSAKVDERIKETPSTVRFVSPFLSKGFDDATEDNFTPRADTFGADVTRGVCPDTWAPPTDNCKKKKRGEEEVRGETMVT